MTTNNNSYQKSSLKEVINHGVESVVCLGTSAVFFGLQYASSHISRNPTINTSGALFGHLGYLFFRDAIIESLASLGHAIGFNQVGETAVTLTNYQENNSSVAHQEAYNQFVEGTNKVAPVILHSIFAQPFYDTKYIGKINLQMELASSYGRSIMYSLRSEEPQSLQYSTTGHFANECELHTKIEAPFLLALTALSTFSTNTPVDLSFIRSLLIDEFFLEFFKGLSFGAIDLVCPECSHELEEIRTQFIEQNLPTPEQHIESDSL